jgi:hypothetical protein
MLRLCVLDFNFSSEAGYDTCPNSFMLPQLLLNTQSFLFFSTIKNSQFIQKKKGLFLSLYITKHLILDFKSAFNTLNLRGKIKPGEVLCTYKCSPSQKMGPCPLLWRRTLLGGSISSNPEKAGHIFKNIKPRPTWLPTTSKDTISFPLSTRGRAYFL